MLRQLGPGARAAKVVAPSVLVIAVALVLLVPTSLLPTSGGPVGGRTSVAVQASATAAPPNPYTDGLAASIVLGQTGFDRAVCRAPLANSTCAPTSAALDSYGDLWVADRGDNRVLEFVPPFETNMSASLVLGQKTFTTSAAATTQSGLNQPSGLAFDAAGDLWVTDSNNERAVEYVPPFHNGMNASLVIGEPGFNTRSLNATNASNLYFPEVPAFSPSGDLFIADYDDNRVLEYQPPFHDGEAASVAIGQQNLTEDRATDLINGSNHPVGITFSSSGALWVADADNNRLLEYLPPFTTNESASLVLGQKDFTTDYAGDGATNLTLPYGVTVDAHGDVWAAEYTGSRIVEYVSPITDGMAASVVLGQAGFGTQAASTSARGVNGVRDIVFDPEGDLWAVDWDNDRVLEYIPPQYSVRFSESGLPSGTEWSVSVGPYAGTSTSSVLDLWVVNGTYTFYAAASNNYPASPGSGAIVVNGTGTTTAVSFSSSSGLGSALLWLILAAVLGIVAVVEAVLLVRRRPRSARPPPTPVAPTPSPPSGAQGGGPGGPGGGSPPPPG